MGKRKPNSNVESVDYFDRLIDEYKKRKFYKCQCKCGIVQFMDEYHFLEKKHRYCTEAANHNFILQSSDYPTMAEC